MFFMEKGLKYIGLTALLAGILALSSCIPTGRSRYDPSTGRYVDPTDSRSISRNDERRQRLSAEDYRRDQARRRVYAEREQREREYWRWRRRTGR